MTQAKQEFEQKNKIIRQQKRQYGCACGKTYLSYPALFTHVKQKHNGKAPGPLVKPRKDSAVKRGRPPIHPHEKTFQQQAQNFNYDQFLTEVIPRNPPIQFAQEYVWQQGVENCKQIFSKFLNVFGSDQPKKKAITCFVLLMIQHLSKSKGQQYCQSQDAGDIIDITNDLVNNQQRYRKRYPLGKKLLVDLLWVFFLWLYKQKFTDHKLQKYETFN